MIMPDVFKLSCVPIPADAPLNFPLEESYFKNLPSTFAVSSSTSSSFRRLTSPDPGPCARTLYNISLTCLISPLRSPISAQLITFQQCELSISVVMPRKKVFVISYYFADRQSFFLTTMVGSFSSITGLAI